MHKISLALAAGLVLAGSPLLAQGRGGGHGGGMGAGPPISPPGHSTMGDRGASSSAREIAAQRGAFGRDFAADRRMTAAERQAFVQQRRDTALRYAQAARAGRPLPRNADRDIRAALDQDIADWRDEFRVGRTEWQAMRDQWIADRETLTPAQWAQRRADWFAVRDAWIARHRDRVQTR